MTKKTGISLLAIILALGSGLTIWKIHETRAKAAKAAKVEAEILKSLSADEVNLLLKDQALVEPEFVLSVANSSDARKAFLKALREHFALAARARREGLAEDETFKRNVNVQQNVVLATMYLHKLEVEAGKPFNLSKEQVEAVWQDPENEKQFELDSKAAESSQRRIEENLGARVSAAPLVGGRLEKSRTAWARTKVLCEMARTDAQFINQREIELRLKVREAAMLASAYLNAHFKSNIKATNEDIRAYLTSHPEYDIKKKRDKAEMVLRRVMAGEDFDKLAKEFSEDRGTNDKGGLYADVMQGSGFLWPEVESTAVWLENGQVADKLVETRVGYHIVKLVSKEKTKNENGQDVFKYSLRHILLQKNFVDPRIRNPEIPRPFMSVEEIARIQVEESKRQNFINDIVTHEDIVMPDDFQFLPAK
jgi:PPIC-type PPIASE domain